MSLDWRKMMGRVTIPRKSFPRKALYKQLETVYMHLVSAQISTSTREHYSYRPTSSAVTQSSDSFDRTLPQKCTDVKIYGNHNWKRSNFCPIASRYSLRLSEHWTDPVKRIYLV